MRYIFRAETLTGQGLPVPHQSRKRYNILPISFTVIPNYMFARLMGVLSGMLTSFHTFSEFSIPPGGEAFFNNPSQIQNILSCVTDNSVSNIDRLIQANGTANLFFSIPLGLFLV